MLLDSISDEEIPSLGIRHLIPLTRKPYHFPIWDTLGDWNLEFMGPPLYLFAIAGPTNVFRIDLFPTTSTSVADTLLL